MTEAASGIFVRAGKAGQVFQQHDIANIGFIVGERCVAVIDTGGSVAEGRELRCAVGNITNKPVCYVINTHTHPDHILGNDAFREPDVVFVGHRNLPRAMAILGPTYLKRAAEANPLEPSPDAISLPSSVVEESMEIDLGNRKLQLVARAQAHTDNDLTVFDPQTQLFWASDLVFREHVPVVGGSGSVNGWLEVLNELRDTKVRSIVPGHGPIAGDWSSAVDDLTRYLTVLRDETRGWLADDGELGEAMDVVGYSEKTNWNMFEYFHKRNVSSAYTELEWEE